MANDTKNRIVKLLNQKEMTLTELSNELGLAPSTINQHLKELLAVGEVRKIPNEFMTKQKYYEINPNYKTRIEATAERSSSMGNFNSTVFKIAGAVAIVIVIGAILFEIGQSPIVNAQSTGSGTYFSLSDSPTVASVSAVNITVSNAYVHSDTTGKWYAILTAQKTFNLINLRNISAELSVANIPVGNYDQIVLNVTNVTAVINNTETGVFLPSNKLLIFGNFNVGNSTNSTSSWINIDVNLDKSLHMTGSGRIILLPVLKLTASNDANLSVAENSIIIVKHPGHTYEMQNSSMDENGTMVESDQPVVLPGTVLNITANGHIVMPMRGVGHEWNNVTAIRSDHGLIIITNVSNVISTIENFTGQANATASGTDAGVTCVTSNYFTDCSDSGSINYTYSPCTKCYGVVTQSAGLHFCGPMPGSGEEWPSYRCRPPLGTSLPNVTTNMNVTTNTSIKGIVGKVA